MRSRGGRALRRGRRSRAQRGVLLGARALESRVRRVRVALRARGVQAALDIAGLLLAHAGDCVQVASRRLLGNLRDTSQQASWRGS